ncbi:MAG: hypothetical protein ACE5JP_16795, partial [Candidatus Bipolaricaulia bacterium]
MYTIKELTEILGLSEYQVRRRIDAVSDMLGAHLKRRTNNRLLVDPEGLELLKQLKNYEETGATLLDASDRIRHEIEGQSIAKPTQSDAKDELISELRERIGSQEREIERLHAVELGRAGEMTGDLGQMDVSTLIETDDQACQVALSGGAQRIQDLANRVKDGTIQTKAVVHSTLLVFKFEIFPSWHRRVHVSTAFHHQYLRKVMNWSQHRVLPAS